MITTEYAKLAKADGNSLMESALKNLLLDAKLKSMENVLNVSLLLPFMEESA